MYVCVCVCVCVNFYFYSFHQCLVIFGMKEQSKETPRFT